MMMGVGFFLERALGLDLKSLTRLNFWIFVPAFLFVHFVESSLTGGELVAIFIHFSLLMAVMYAIAWTLATRLGYSDRLRRAMTVSVLFYNSGNYGAPAAQLALGAAGTAIEAVIILLQNFTNFTIGLGLHAGGSGMARRDQLKAMLRLPMIYVFVVACVWRYFSHNIPGPLGTAAHYLADGMVSMALVTLGAQMAGLESYAISPQIVITLFLRLLLAPAVGLGIAWGMGLHGVLAQAVVIASSFPVAVNSALLALEFDNEPAFSAAVVFYSTLFSTFTVSFVILAARTFIR
jgi:predicted permease